MSRLDGKVALVTGGASGMGLAMARRFLADGASVVVADLNPATGHRAVADLAATAGVRVRFERVDVAEEDDVAGAVAAAVEAYGRLDVVCNNAGVGGAFGPVTELHVDDWDYTFGVLVRGVFLGVKHGARQMVAQGGGGSIINTGSIAGLSGGAGPLCYSAAKAAVANLTRAAAVELAPHRIRVNAINPGVVMTPLLLGGRTDRDDEVAAGVSPYVPWPEVGRPDHIAGVAAFLAGDDAEYVTGEGIVVDGGTVAAGPGLSTRTEAGAVPAGWVGANRGTTGEATIVRRRPDR